MIEINIKPDIDFKDQYEKGCGRDSLLSQLTAAENWISEVKENLCTKLNSKYLTEGGRIKIEDHKHTPKNQSS